MGLFYLIAVEHLKALFTCDVQVVCVIKRSLETCKLTYFAQTRGAFV